MTRPNRYLTRVWRSAVGFPAHKKLDAAKNAFRSAVGKRFAIDPDTELFPQLKTILSEGRMSRMNAAAFVCINSNEHEASKFNRLGFLKKFLDLYTADSWQECAEIEEYKEGSGPYKYLQTIGSGTLNHTSKMEHIKEYCWLRDVNHATRPGYLESLLRRSYHIATQSIEHVLAYYNKEAAAALDLADKEEEKRAKLEGRKAQKDLMAMPKDVFLPMLRKAKKAGNLSDTQCAMMLMFILHSREKRHDGESYIKHPVAVAKLVEKHGAKFLWNNEEQLWMATLAALLHDAWEENDIDSIRDDLEGLLPEPVIKAVEALHKKEGEAYFDYLQRVACNRLAAVVKICDLNNNSSDMDLEKNKGSAKQAYVYTIAANYMKFRLENPKNDISVEDFVRRTELCSDEVFKEIDGIAESKDKIDENGKVIKAAKKVAAAKFLHLKLALTGVVSAKDILEDKPDNAHSRGKENPPLHPRPDV